jgi:hypothetical protein
MNYLLPFVNITFAASSALATRRLLQRYDSTSNTSSSETNELPLTQNGSFNTIKIVNSCVICGSDEGEDEPVIKAPCGQHYVCTEDIVSFFEHATNNESLYPPRCCNQVFLLQDYEEHVPADVALAYQTKERGEYAILAK